VDQFNEAQGVVFHPIFIEKQVSGFLLRPHFQVTQTLIRLLVVIAGDSMQAEILKFSILWPVLERINTVDQLQFLTELTG